MADLNSSPSNEKPNLDVLFPNLKKSDTALPAPRFMAPTTAAATLLKGAPASARVVPPPPSLRSKPASVKPPPPSARAAEPIRPVDDDELLDDGPTIALHSPMLPAPITSRPAATAPRPSGPMPPPSRRAAPPAPSSAKLPPLPSAPSSGKHSAPVAAKPSTPSAAKLPPVPMPPPSSLRNVAPPSQPMASAPVLPLPPYTDEDAESFAPPPVSAKASRASAAASLAAASGPVRAYVPPSMLPPVSRPVSAQETIPASRAHSLMPTAASVPPPPLPQKKSRGGLVAVAAFASLAVLGGLGFAAVKGSAALGVGSAGTGSMSVTAAGPGGAKVDGLRVFVDGVVKCDSAPCRLGELRTGTHFISADAPGFAATAARTVSVERGAEATLHIDLVPAATPAAAQPAPEAKVEAKATPVDQLDTEKAEKAAPAERNVAERASKPEKKEAKKDDAKKADVAKDDAKKAIAEEGGLLNINSIPVANVVLDGRPVGSTPLIGVKVSAGPHSVVFIHPEHGRKASGTTVKAGGTATVAVRF